jgi:HAE1 family hydrophobic/amphiphilic exporter-1
MAIGLGEGSESMAPMAQFVVGGLLLSTLLTLVFIPVLYTYADDLIVRVANRRKKKGVKASLQTS